MSSSGEAEPRRRAPSSMLLAVLTLACLLPFSGKAFNVDDPLFLWSAQQIAKHPLDPYGLSVIWDASAVPLSAVTKNPPLASGDVLIMPEGNIQTRTPPRQFVRDVRRVEIELHQPLTTMRWRMGAGSTARFSGRCRSPSVPSTRSDTSSSASTPRCVRTSGVRRPCPRTKEGLP